MTYKRLVLVLISLAALSASGVSLAHGGHGGGHGGGFGGGHAVGHGGGFGGFHGGAFRGGHFGGFHHHVHGGFGFYLGAPFYWPYYYSSPYYSYPYYYSYPSAVLPSTPPVYIEQGAAPKIKPLDANNWDYCANPQGYYPHVKECPSGWQTIEAQPTGQEPGYWYYCRHPAGYYPYVRACTDPWQKIVP